MVIASKKNIYVEKKKKTCTEKFCDKQKSKNISVASHRKNKKIEDVQLYTY